MNNERQSIKQAVKSYYTSKSLSDVQNQSLLALQKTLQPSKENTPSDKPFTLQWVGSIAASLLLFIIVFGYTYTPAVITAAYADVMIDADLNNGMQSTMSQWMSDNHIRGVPQRYSVEMSKFCNLDQYKTTHLRIAGSEQGIMHLFFHHGDSHMHQLKRTGTVDKMNWKMIEVRENLTVIVLYTDDMRESAMQNILGEMLPELQA